MKNLLPILFLVLSHAISASAQGTATANTNTDLDPQYAPFYHGVASGDPLHDRVIIWTRVTPDVSGPVTVSWRMATDTAFNQIVANGNFTTNDNMDYTVKIDVTGLQASTYYYYEFSTGGRNSLIGRTKTTPMGDNDSLRLAVVSCSNFKGGYFNVYKSLTQRNDFDAVVHLGDYIYEYGSGGSDVRPILPTTEIITLPDYRARYAHYRLDHDLRTAHQQYPWIVVWDDHETANNSWNGGAENHTPGTEGTWTDRKEAAIRAHHEWLPIRLPDTQNPEKIYRKIEFGNLANLIMMDTRLIGRDIQVGTTAPNVNDTSRHIIGTTQLDWLLAEMENTPGPNTWNILGQQVMMAPLTVFGSPVNMDQWDGYPAERTKLFSEISSRNLDQIVVLTGDIHTSWANDLPFGSYNASTGAGSIGVEFVASSVTSSGFPFPVPASFIQGANPHIKYAELSKKGYVILDINKTRTQGDIYHISTVTDQNYTEARATSWFCKADEKFLRQATEGAIPSSTVIYPQAPMLPNNPSGIEDKNNVVLFGTYPNPFVDRFIASFFLYQPETIEAKIFDMTGKQVYSKSLGLAHSGLNYIEMNATELSKGQYLFVIASKDKMLKRAMIKME